MLDSFLFICDFGVRDQFLGVFVHHFYRVLEFTVVDPFFIDEFPDFCDELAGPFLSRFLLPT